MKHKPLNWVTTIEGVKASSISHDYFIWFNYKEGWKVTTYNLHSKISHSDKVCDTLEEAKDWVETVHVPTKTKELINAFIEVC